MVPKPTMDDLGKVAFDAYHAYMEEHFTPAHGGDAYHESVAFAMVASAVIKRYSDSGPTVLDAVEIYETAYRMLYVRNSTSGRIGYNDRIVRETSNSLVHLAMLAATIARKA